MSEPGYVDGNALGGLLGEVFAADLTMADLTCGHCGAVAPLARLHVFLDAPGAVGRCEGCGAVEVRIVRTETRYWLDLSGARAIQIPREAMPGASSGADG